MDAGTYVRARGHHDHRCRRALADLAAHLVAVLVGQAEIEEYDSEGVRLGDERPERLLAAAGVPHVEAVPGEDRRQSGGDMVVVLDEKQSHHGPLRFIGRSAPALRRALYVHARAAHQGIHSET